MTKTNKSDQEPSQSKVIDYEEKCKILRKQLRVATQALEEYANRRNWQDIEVYDMEYFNRFFLRGIGYKTAEDALKVIRKLKR